MTLTGSEPESSGTRIARAETVTRSEASVHALGAREVPLWLAFRWANRHSVRILMRLRRRVRWLMRRGDIGQISQLTMFYDSTPDLAQLAGPRGTTAAHR